MTMPARDGRDAPFADWLRKHPGLDSMRECISVQNTDVWVHRYSPRKEKRKRKDPPTVGELIDQIQHIEVKTFDAEEPFAQKDTFSVVDDLLRSTSIRKNGRRYAAKIKDRRKPGQKRFVRYLGHHVLQMSAESSRTVSRYETPSPAAEKRTSARAPPTDQEKNRSLMEDVLATLELLRREREDAK